MVEALMGSFFVPEIWVGGLCLGSEPPTLQDPFS